MSDTRFVSCGARFVASDENATSSPFAEKPTLGARYHHSPTALACSPGVLTLMRVVTGWPTALSGLSANAATRALRAPKERQRILSTGLTSLSRDSSPACPAGQLRLGLWRRPTGVAWAWSMLCRDLYYSERCGD